MTLGVAVYAIVSLVVICCLFYIAYRMYKSRAAIARCWSRVRHKKPAARSITIRVGTESTPRLMHGHADFCPYRGSYSSGCSSSSGSDSSGSSENGGGVLGGRLCSFSCQSTMGYEDRVYENRFSVSSITSTCGGDDGESLGDTVRAEVIVGRRRDVQLRDRVVQALGNDFEAVQQDLDELMCRLETEIETEAPPCVEA